MNKKKNTILVIDSDIQSQKMMKIVLDDADFNLVDCLTGKQAERLAVSTRPDLVLLDLDLPDIDGGDIITALRGWSEVPIIILSARAHDNDVVKALNMGANDYVIKPFSANILLARINASLRSSAVKEAGEPELVNGPLRVDLVRHEVFVNDDLIAFTPKEYNLLRYLIIHRGKMLSHRDILKAVWGDGHADDTQYLRVFIGQIREKIDRKSGVPSLIVTEAGVGYRMENAEIMAL
ncbi:MAG: response regulator transcription factor [Alphaproteobacteria bacterium]|jgi:two-component system KDP operon response regulator KdpE|nr:response regulator transcription factor [Alphaproteobacteria bacterium]MDP7223428.1 response regulator transcription factor [Alphaproteobacteria bacterium]